QEATATVNRGQQISSAISTVTSVAISPLLGVCLLGAWDYFRTPQVQRIRLPFYTSPVFWIPISLLLVLIFIKDTVGGFAPIVKKPLDAIEVLLLNKASLVVIGFPVLFHQIEAVAGANSLKSLFTGILRVLDPVVYASSGPSGFVDTAGHVTLTVLAVLAGSAALVVVWLVGHSIDVLLLLNPFPFLDVLLKGFRVGVFALLVGTSLISRTAGLALSLLIILICALCAGWAFRVAVFGSVFAWDLLRTMLLGLKREPDTVQGIRCFSVSRRWRIPKRTYGRLVLSPKNTLEFCYRRWGFGPLRRVTLSGDVPFELGRGLLQPSLIVLEEASDKFRILFRMLPGYRGSEEGLRQMLGLGRVCDIRVPHGLRAFWRWVNDSGEERPATAA
ncbi:MAG: hypothetical protein JOY54_15335, partial [Acidobacteriaceae bacterium]|nr:hypothetical protein [Acidobacteriaceae bacterium]